MSEHYILDGHNPRPAELFEWAGWFETHDRHVDETHVGAARVSTVFLGLDHRFGTSGPPLLFETMIFGGPHDGYQQRYSTWDEAQAGHAAAVALASERQPASESAG